MSLYSRGLSFTESVGSRSGYDRKMDQNEKEGKP